MNIKELFNGIAIIIDNEIYEKDSDIMKIKENIEKNNIPIVTYNDVPDLKVINALSAASFIILDWDFNDSTITEDTSDRLTLPFGLREAKQKDVVDFIKKILEKLFVPIFIFTALEAEKVSVELVKENIACGKSDRIFIKQKIDITSEDDLFKTMSEWLENMPSVYVLKEWEKVIQEAKNDMFLELYGCSPGWVTAIWGTSKNDGIGHAYEFGTFISKNLINRISSYNFEEKYMHDESGPKKEDLYKLFERERYIKYLEQPERAYTGDLFKIGGDYFLNIRAQCDITRMKKSETEYNPMLYVIRGEKIRDKNIVNEYIKIDENGLLVFSPDDAIPLDEIAKNCNKKIELDKINQKITKHMEKPFFQNGELREKKPEAIIPCIDDGKIVKFDLSIQTMKFTEIKEQRIGRILPPYIGRIQQRCAQYIVREGVMPVPDELFKYQII